MERERQAEGAKAGGLHQAKRDAHAQLKRLTKDLEARFVALCTDPLDQSRTAVTKSRHASELGTVAHKASSINTRLCTAS